MATPFQGRIVDENGLPLPGLTLVAPDDDPEARPLAVTDADGVFSLAAPPAGQVLVADVLGCRALARVPSNLNAPLVIARERALGWLVCDEKGQGREVIDGNDVEVLVDQDIFSTIANSVSRAKRFVNLSQLLFFPSFLPYDTGNARLFDEFLAANRRGADVRILVNENAVVPDTYDDLLETLDAEGDNTVMLRCLTMSPNVLHAKVLVIDGEEAFVIGPPFEQKYWDTPRHAVAESRRGNDSPLHDLTVRIRGPAVADLDRFFAELWNIAAPSQPPLAPCAPPPPAGAQRIQATHTLPPRLLPHAPDGERGVLEAYVRGLANAERFVYLENQYFTNPTVAKALRAALDRNERLEAILVLNEWTDIPTYIGWQNRRLQEMGWPDHPRLGVFGIWTHAPSGREMRPVYVHSKLAMADDAWATLGTANLDSLSLEEANEFGVPMDQNVELNVTLLDGIGGAPATGVVGRLRRRLWAEHLGDEGIWTTQAPPGGWLTLWKRVADENFARIERGETMLHGAVLPYLPGPVKKLVAAKGRE